MPPDHLALIKVHQVVLRGTFSPARVSRSASLARWHPGASGDAFPPPGRPLKDSKIIEAPPAGLVGRDDQALFTYIESLRLSIKAKVATEQQRGLSLSEIVVQVREMVRVAEEAAQYPRPFPSREFRAISRQAIAWCVEAYRPQASSGANEFLPRPIRPDPLAFPEALDPAGPPLNRFPDRPPA